ncbi:MAG: hypothetical protein CVU35_00070 [Betaproteobacteria bacterium HGW-Betaproteobacteria-8]|nr:MAG: hypothetical protein CVU35_00070 [Betaproteobacteria bacterium HGW-Betaproteobacteria-8]
MKASLLIGVLLIVLGTAALVYGSFSYTTEETVIQIGALKATAEVQKEILVPDIVAVISIIAGILILIVRRKSK